MTATQFAALVKADVASHFKDPLSVQWRGVFVTEARGAWLLCGEINAKNSYGGYVGFTRVMATPAATGQSPTIESEFKTLPAIFTALWQQDCSTKIVDID